MDRVNMSQHQQQIYSEVVAAIREVVPKVAPERIRPEAALIDLEIDSLRLIDLTLSLESRLGDAVFLPDWISRVEHPRDMTVASLVDFLADTVAQAA